MPDDLHDDAVAGDVIGVVVFGRQLVESGSPIRRTASRGDSSSERTPAPSTTRIRCRDDPPSGVRRQPAMSSNLTSARCA
jgi:hypothetical protein